MLCSITSAACSARRPAARARVCTFSAMRAFSTAPLWPSTRDLASGLLARDRSSLARAITLIESTRADHRRQAELLLDTVLAARRRAEGGGGGGGASSLPAGVPPTFRVGVAGPPGAGKSTLIEALGKHVLRRDASAHVAVVAVDPSSSRSGGSILGDKTRMEELARADRAFVRPSPTRGALGGIARDTSDVVLLCEAGGYSTVLVETVGLGQSEIAVEGVIDFLVLVVPPAGGDELQGSKKGIVEVADLIVVNKADGELAASARHAAGEYARALHLVRAKHGEVWAPRVLRVSAATGDGVPQLWDTACEFQASLGRAGTLLSRRRAQAGAWMWADFQASLLLTARQDEGVQAAAGGLLPLLADGSVAPRRAAQLLLDAFNRRPAAR